MSKTMSIYDAITRGTTISNNSVARVKSELVGIDTFAVWRAAQNTAYEVFYKYMTEQHKTARRGKDATMDKTIVDDAYKALQDLLDCVGEVNGHKLVKNESMLNMVASCTMVDKKYLVGETLTQESIVKNLREEVKGIHTGMNAEYIADLTHRLEIAEIKLKELKKQENSCKTTSERVKNNAFYIAIERKLAIIANDQDAMTWEELEERDAKIEADRKAKRKANKQSKKSAK